MPAFSCCLAERFEARTKSGWAPEQLCRIGKERKGRSMTIQIALSGDESRSQVSRWLPPARAQWAIGRGSSRRGGRRSSAAQQGGGGRTSVRM
jgi:hypothetical protein